MSTGQPSIPARTGIEGLVEHTRERTSDRAVLHLTEATRTYPCPNCGANLAWNPTSQDLGCGACGTHLPLTPDVAEPTQVIKRDLDSTMEAFTAQNQTAQFQADKEIVCQNCGGHTLFTGTLTTVRCPYCNTPIQRDDVQDSPLRLPIDAVLPLSIDLDTATQAIEKWINTRRLAPSAFKKYRQLGSFTSVYLPYFSYDAATTTRYDGARGVTRVEVYTDSEGNTHTRTHVDWYPVAGVVKNAFADVTGHATAGLQDEKVTELEPWPMEAAHPYSPQFVAGHLARTYDADPRQVFDRLVEPRMESVIEQTICSDIGGDFQRIHSMRVLWHMLRFAQLALPVWMLTVTFKGQPFQVMVNGVTGEVQGQRPWSAVKITLLVLLGVAIVIALLLLYQYYEQTPH
ncbi:hypothetical protein HMPREF1531_02262 [Propionibacterium sp. oral taxon 192 str. F0372]|uniref:hypothetical protein n=1 Tax=Propionibacterium sp. oral taxon 192 TaxID=671222 RepID=UPI0003543139|nr:hypothetical protein [Propionibacterium sp. oral taxon 192]EPH02944.1 hypothetical protein HMPREF1531_02262 [Propionibacterium sp. oral taxon 192 str. F0372]